MSKYIKEVYVNERIHKEPEECSDTDENGDENEHVREEKDLEGRITEDNAIDITKQLEDCHISSRNTDEIEVKSDSLEDDLINKLSGVSIKENAILFTPENTGISNQAQISELEARGPMRGIATDFRQGTNTTFFNSVESSWNYPESLPNFNCTSGKRKQAEYEENPTKFLSPSVYEEHLNDLDMMESRPLRNNQESNVDVAVVPDMCDIDNLLQMLGNGTDNNFPGSNKLQSDLLDYNSEGYASEDSPVHETAYSPVGIDSPPPSNLSHLSDDSGISNSSQSMSSPDQIYKYEVESPMPKSCDDLFEERKDELADLLNILARDIKNDEKLKKEDMARRNLPQKASNELNASLPPKECQTWPRHTNEENNRPLNNFMESNEKLPVGQHSTRIKLAAKENNFRCPNTTHVSPQTTAGSLVSCRQAIPISVNILPSGNCHSKPLNTVPSSTCPILVISQNQPLVVVSPIPIKPTQQTKKQSSFVPILPRLTPVNQKISTVNNVTSTSRVPTTVVAAAEEHVANNSDKKPTHIQKYKVDDNKRLNLARRLVAKMTSDDLKFQDNEGDTYLHVAACKSDKNMVQALLERLEREKLLGMIDVHNLRRQTALYCAVSGNNPGMVEMLLRYGADINTLAERVVQSNHFKDITSALSALHVASTNGNEYLATLRTLLQSKDLLLNNPNSDGQTALHCAILCHNKNRNNQNNEYIDSRQVIELLINHGADINAQDKKNGKTPLMYALESRNVELIYSVVKNVDADKKSLYLVYNIK
ncbi:hypothetical protein LOTGIDRAFT_230541 [Lottia gigantea]|uniref:Uncharacterized protein n=1 Tax=Lottia gigantea TaxID=225164 RepID=V4ADC6_LOTGI|nr:hypothetical protein LOTGIDRAFT_230541 [Lottia gigantea]ESP02009.1 hypothetical protein LOTGIDRAFT_230541 [Lottia gigantea]